MYVYTKFEILLKMLLIVFEADNIKYTTHGFTLTDSKIKIS